VADVTGVHATGLGVHDQAGGPEQRGSRAAGVEREAEHRAPAVDVDRVRQDFPVLARPVHGRRLVYLDSAASAQHPIPVLEAMDRYYQCSHANVHRGVYALAEEADHLYEQARRTVGSFIGAPDPAHEVVFTKNATESLNLMAAAWGRHNLRSGDVVVLTEMEHHANIVPWLMLAEERGIVLRWIGLDAQWRLDLSNLDRLLDGARLLAVSAMSNVLGTVPPLAELTDAAHRAGAIVVADGAQLVPHRPVDVTALGIDALAFSGHKMLGPTGIGVLWARRSLLEAMPPFLGGGGMISDVTLDGFSAGEVPDRFEAGTPPIAEAVGLAAAVGYLRQLGMAAVEAHERQLTDYAFATLTDRFGERLVIHGPPPGPDRGGVLSLALDGVHPHDLAQVLDQSGVCVRAGHHCAKPLMRRLGVPATARASFYVYNDEADVDALADALAEAATLFG
jgi:cysteine desulfurase/selenocysteine lyase